MYFHHRNGSYHRVRGIGNGGLPDQKGGITMYYIPHSRDRVKAFAPVGLKLHWLTAANVSQGFRMLAGDAANDNPSRVDKASICHRCWNQPTEDNFVGGAPCTGSDTVDIPADPSCKMIRQTIIFPTYVA